MAELVDAEELIIKSFERDTFQQYSRMDLKSSACLACRFETYSHHCVRGRLGNALDCGSSLCGFKSHRTP